MRLCVIVNAIITALITFIVATPFVFVGYVAHDGVAVAGFPDHRNGVGRAGDVVGG